ncbi:MAG: MATE family efflux transporter [Bacteroidaceae bacterium]|nr:MATE family efflux transporter [Bacteroidaceae bacterium]
MKQRTPAELGTQPIGRLLWQYALPSIVAMTASSLYNNVDRFFIGQGVGVQAIAGLATTFPFMNLSAAVGAMVGVGASTVISVRLGQKDVATAKHVLGNTVSVNIILGILFTLLCWWWLDDILYLFGATANDISYARDYMQVILLGNTLTHCYFGLNAVLRAAGRPQSAMMCTLLTVVVNTILDPIFIWWFGWGIRGAAIATILSQAISLAIQLRLLSDKREAMHFCRGIYRPSFPIVRQILAIGMSPFLMNACACLVVGLINNQLERYGGGLAKGAYGIVNGIIFIFIMIVMGFNQGMQPIVGYNWGAKQDERVWRALRLTIIAGTSVTTLGFLVGMLFPRQIVSWFISADDPQVEAFMEHAVRGFRIIVCVFPVVGSQMVITNFFQSIGHAAKSMFQSVTRQMLFLLPLLWLMPKAYGLNGVWFAMPMSDTLSAVVTWLMLWWLVWHLKHKRS